MKTDTFRGRSAKSVVIVATIALVLALAAVVTVDWGPPPAAATHRGLIVTLAVEPFETADSVPGSWQSVAFAESLATRLSLVPGLQAQTVTAESGSRYTLHGRITMQDGRLVLATRLGRDAKHDTVWTATFWRNPASGTSILPDLASAVAEAVMNETIRQAQKEKR